MLFSSMTFVYIFLPLVCIAYFFVRPETRNCLLLLASIIFYGWGEPNYLAVMIMTIVLNYIGALLLDRYRAWKLPIAVVTIVLDLSFLCYFKYFNFVAENINGLFSLDIKFIEVIMPIGISFYTFQAMSYLLDVYRGDSPVQKDLYKLSLYITLFPQLVAGPIVKYHDVSDQIEYREVTFEKVSYGVKRFIIGLSKKMLIANTLGSVADKIFMQPVEQFDALTAWTGALAYSLQLFYDFSGYSDMAIGLGMIFGFRFLENFNYPYISRSITEFWRRWHISLSTWFREYLYIPLGGNRVEKWRMYVNLFIVFLATGLWHGAEWTFVIWGLWHGLFIIIEKATGWHRSEGGIVMRAVHHVYALAVVIVGWVLFRSESLSYAAQYLKNMTGMIENHRLAFDYSYYVGTVKIAAFAAALVCAVPAFKNILTARNGSRAANILLNAWLIVLFLLSSAAVAASTYNPFIYFRF